MNDQYEMRKRAAALLWLVLSSLIFWLMSLLSGDTFDEKSFINYMFLFVGGGYSFHFLSTIMNSPANEENYVYWGLLSLQLIAASVTILLAFVVVYSEKYWLSLGGVPSLIAIFFAAWRISLHALKASFHLNSIKNRVESSSKCTTEGEG